MQVSQVTPAAGQTVGSVQEATTNAFGLSFENLLRIILTQLTFQDPLKPMENFEFVSQLAQFSQLQLGQTGNDRLLSLVGAQGSLQAMALLGRTVDVPADGVTLSGKVVSVVFSNGSPQLTIETPAGRTVSNLPLSSVTQIRQED